MRTHGGGSSGKWLDNNTPKRGWSCTGAEDLGKGITVECEMCEREKVRYIHHMLHGDKTPLKLRVGCICAGHMEGREDNEQAIKRANSAAKQRDKDLRNRTARRDRFVGLPSWKISKSGNEYLKKDNHHIVIISGRYGGYSAIVDSIRLDRWVETEDDAKLIAFDYLYPPRI